LLLEEIGRPTGRMLKSIAVKKLKCFGDTVRIVERRWEKALL